MNHTILPQHYKFSIYDRECEKSCFWVNLNCSKTISCSLQHLKSMIETSLRKNTKVWNTDSSIKWLKQSHHGTDMLVIIVPEVKMRYEVFLTGWDQKIISTFFLIKFQYEFESVHFYKKKKLTSCRILSGIWNMVDYISNYKIWWTRYQILEPPLDKCLSFTFKLRWGGQFCFISCYRFLPGSHFNPCQSFLQFVSVDILDSDPWRISGCLKMSSSSKSEPWFH